MQTLSIPQKDKIILAFGDIGRMLYEDPRRYTYDEVDQVLELLRTRGYEVVPLNRPAPMVLPAEVAPAAQAQPAPGKLSLNDANWIQDVIQKYQHAKAANIAGFNFKNEAVGRILNIFCRALNIPFKL